MLDGCHGMFECPLIPTVFPLAEMEDQKLQRQDLRGLERTLHLVHAVDAPGLIRVDHVYRRSPAPPHLRVRKERHMHGKRLHGIDAEPVGNLFHLSAVGVIEMLARGEDLNRLRSTLGQGIEQSRM